MKNLITFKNPKSRTAEAFRTLRTNIQFSSLDKELKSIVVTSCGPGEGKSVVMCNLAVTIAESGKSVVVLDCDLRKPTIHTKMGISNKIGVTNILSQNMSIKECIVETDVENLRVIPSGPIPPNPSEMLATKKMRNLIDELSKEYDIVLIDAPPVLAVTDAQILATIVDGVIFVVAHGQAQKDAIVKSKQLLENVGGKLLGVVLNKIPESSKGYYYSKYYSKDGNSGYYVNEG